MRYKPALLIIDMQNAFCEMEGTMGKLGFDVSALREPIPFIQQLLSDAHRSGSPVIMTRYIYRPDYSDGGILISEMLPQIRDLDGLKAGTWDVQIINELKPASTEIVIDKNRYSAFFGTRLESLLQEKGIDTLVVTGVTTNMCVESTVRDAHYRDFRVLVVREATAEVDVDRHENALKAIQFGFGQVIGIDEGRLVLGKQR